MTPFGTHFGPLLEGFVGVEFPIIHPIPHIRLLVGGRHHGDNHGWNVGFWGSKYQPQNGPKQTILGVGV